MEIKEFKEKLYDLQANLATEIEAVVNKHVKTFADSCDGDVQIQTIDVDIHPVQVLGRMNPIDYRIIVSVGYKI